uniref:ribosomal protein L18 n=1 Tax=Polyopes affinis TaxID=194519 RepID=UPI002A8371A7|nr:ribosomal protein L18 [Polyopes affinis]WOL37054.1 ribosomal protein L18 [Polyopes affinis]
MKKKIKGTSERPRLYIFKSNKHIYVQLIDDVNKIVLASSSSISPHIKQQNKSSTTCNTARLIGKDIAIQSNKKNITKIVFDRGHRKYHGQIKALAESTREIGIIF